MAKVKEEIKAEHGPRRFTDEGDEVSKAETPVEDLPEDTDQLLKQLEERIQKDAALKSRAKVARQAAGGDGTGRFTIETIHTDAGKKRDAILQFGQHKGRAVSELVLQAEGARYLRWILTEEFNPVLKQIVREYLGIPQPVGGEE